MRTYIAGITLVLLGCLPLISTADDTEQANPCLDCHETDLAQFEATVHGATECLDCHVGADERQHKRGLDPVDCGACHNDVVEEQLTSAHGELGPQKFPDPILPGCSNCHGEVHTMAPYTDDSSPVSSLAQGETCGACHGAARPEGQSVRTVRPIEAYTASVHAKAVHDHNPGPGCSDCHSAHSPLPATDPSSSIHRRNVPETCGGCHRKIAREFSSSIHGLAANAGVYESPVCTDCHGEHRILAITAPGSRVSASNIPIQVCGPCHSDLKLGEKYGLPAEQVPSYGESFHGLAARGGSLRVANCASCHGVHNILPSTDPASHTHPDNLAETCGQCHPGAGTRFAIGPVHVLAAETPNIVAHWIRLIYIPLIWVTVLGMLAHNLLDLARKTREPTPRLRKPPEQCIIRERMSRPFRFAHGLAAISFIVLVYTGFALKYPESWWAGWLQFSDGQFRGLGHRVAAVGLMGACFFHFAHLAVSARARSQMAAFLPKTADAREFVHRLGYNLGRRAEPPAPTRVGYVEKVEYWAALWGTFVTAVTGLVLWFENLTLTWLPGWVPEAATVLHFLEAILATLAILIWHFYSVMFDPKVYPIDMTWLTGKPPFSRAEERGEVICEDDGKSEGTQAR